MVQWLYDRRDPLSWAMALGMALPLLWLGAQWEQMAPHALQEMTALLEMQSLPTPLPSIPTPPRPMPQPRQAVVQVPVPLPVPVPVVQAPMSPDRVAMERAAPPPSAAPAAPAHTVAPHTLPASAEEARPTVRAAAYEGLLLAYLERIKRYPSSREARLGKPQGTVRLWLLISRQGELLDAGVQTSSGSNLLDSEALRTVRVGQFPAFPEDAFAGEPRHRFTVSLKYQIEG